MAAPEKLAKRVWKYFTGLCREASNAATLGDNDAALYAISLMTAEAQTLKTLGWTYARDERGNICAPTRIVPIEDKPYIRTIVSVDLAAVFLGCAPRAIDVEVALARVQLLRRELNAGENEDILTAWERFKANGTADAQV